MKNKLALFLPLGLMLSMDFVLTLNTYYSYDLISNNQLIRTASAVFAGLKALFFLPVVIFQLLGVVIDMVRDSIWLQSQSLRGGQFVDAVIEIPLYWQFITFGLAIGYAYFLASGFANPATRRAFIWRHAALFAFYLFLFGTLQMVWQFNPEVYDPAGWQPRYLFLVGGVLTYASVPTLLFGIHWYLNRKKAEWGSRAD
jgi:hypothetical protein